MASAPNPLCPDRLDAELLQNLVRHPLDAKRLFSLADRFFKSVTFRGVDRLLVPVSTQDAKYQNREDKGCIVPFTEPARPPLQSVPSGLPESERSPRMSKSSIDPTHQHSLRSKIQARDMLAMLTEVCIDFCQKRESCVEGRGSGTVDDGVLTTEYRGHANYRPLSFLATTQRHWAAWRHRGADKNRYMQHRLHRFGGMPRSCRPRPTGRQPANPKATNSSTNNN